MKSVALTYSNNYDIPTVEASLRILLAHLEIDIGAEVRGKRVLLKPNLLTAYTPDKAVTTHPKFIEALVRIIKDYDCELWLGDSPNGVQQSLEDVWNKSGMETLCNRYGVVKKLFEKGGATLKNDILISNAVLEADYLINLPKFKTHGLTVLTLAVKNMFGIVPGLRKTDFHRTSKTRADFATNLVKIAEIRKPDLNIMDGITAMAGNGPSGGYPLHVGLVAMGRDAHAIDFTITKLLKIDAKDIDTLKAAEVLGLINLADEVNIIMDSNVHFDFSDFKLPISYTAGLRNSRLFNFLISRLMINMRVRPKVNRAKCSTCEMCVEICPESAIEICGGRAKIDNSKCKECYCCHEICPERAIKLRESLCLKIAKLMSSRRS